MAIHYSIENLNHECCIHGCENKATVHLSGKGLHAGYYCSDHTDLDMIFRPLIRRQNLIKSGIMPKAI